jgi:hypothetical protein
MQLDHLAVTAASLAQGRGRDGIPLGVPLEPGGRHARFGTHNRLLSLGPGEYLESSPRARQRSQKVPAGSPSTTPRPRAPHLDRPRPDLAAGPRPAPPEAGEALDLSRGPFAWSVSVPPDGALPWGGAFPHLIQWRAAATPARTLPRPRRPPPPRSRSATPRPAPQTLLADFQDPRVTVIPADAPHPPRPPCHPQRRGVAVIRPATPQDAPQLAAIWNTRHPALHRDLLLRGALGGGDRPPRRPSLLGLGRGRAHPRLRPHLPLPRRQRLRPHAEHTIMLAPEGPGQRHRPPPHRPRGRAGPRPGQSTRSGPP